MVFYLRPAVHFEFLNLALHPKSLPTPGIEEPGNITDTDFGYCNSDTHNIVAGLYGIQRDGLFVAIPCNLEAVEDLVDEA
jgi:hypothetical protein